MTASFLRRSDLWRNLAIILLAAGASALAGLSVNLSLGLAGMVVVTILFLRPDWALYVLVGSVVVASALPSITLPVLGGVALILPNVLIILVFVAGLLHQFRNGWRWRWNSSFTLMLLFVGWTAITLSWTPDLRDGIVRVINWAVLLIAYFVLANELETPENRDRAFVVLALMGWFLIFASLLSFGSIDKSGRLHVLTENPNTLSSRLLFCSIGMLGIYKKGGTHSTLKAVGAVIYILAAGLVIARTASRGEMLGWLVLVVLLAGRFRSQTIASIPAIVLISMLVSRFGIADFVLSRYDDPTMGGRMTLWEASWTLFREKPLLGLGVGATQQSLAEVVNASRGRSPHNPFLVVLLDTGLIGLTLYAGLIFAPPLRFLSTLRKHIKPTWWAVPLEAWVLLASVSAYAFAWFKSGGAQHDIALYYFLALLMAYTSQYDKADRITQESRSV